MADFVQQSITKTALRKLTAPIANAAAIKTIADSVITTNQFGCTSYEQGGVTMDPVAISRQIDVARILYQDDDGKTVGQVSVPAPTTAAFATMKTEFTTDAEMTATMGGNPAVDTEREPYQITLWCRDLPGELYYVTLSRDQVRVSSYSDDAILAFIEAWADTVPALA